MRQGIKDILLIVRTGFLSFKGVALNMECQLTGMTRLMSIANIWESEVVGRHTKTRVYRQCMSLDRRDEHCLGHTTKALVNNADASLGVKKCLGGA